MDNIQSTPKASDENIDNKNSLQEIATWLWDFVRPLIVLALVIFSFRSTVFDWYEIPSGSMLPTLQIGDRVFVKKFAYNIHVPFTKVKLLDIKEPSRGDIVVFTHPPSGLDYVKRVVGLPGDLIEIRQNVLYINKEAVYKNEASIDDVPPDAEIEHGQVMYSEKINDHSYFVFEREKDDFPETRVPSDYYFMMGDNRDNSSDSRMWGFVPKDNIQGKAIRTLLSFNNNIPFYQLSHYRLARSFYELE